MSSTPNESQLYVGRISFNNTDEDRLREVFGEFGTVGAVKVIDRTVPDKFNPERERRQKFAFVTFTSEESQADADDAAEKAIAALNETDLDGQNIIVKKAEKPADRPRGDFNRGGNRDFNRGGNGYNDRGFGGDRGGYSPRNGGSRRDY